MTDSSKENPKLHAPYVSWPMHELEIINRAIDEISNVHRVNMSIIAGALKSARDKILKSDAAWQEVFIRLATDQPSPETDETIENTEIKS